MDRAAADFERAIALGPRTARIHNNAANLYRTQRDLGRAEAHYTRAVELDPRYGRAWLNRAMTRLLLGNVSGASADVERSLALQGRIGAPFTVRGNVRLLQGDVAGALADQTRALALAPGFDAPRRNRACAALARGWLAQAALDFAHLDALRDEGRCGGGTSIAALPIGQRFDVILAFLRSRYALAVAAGRPFAVAVLDEQRIVCAPGVVEDPRTHQQRSDMHASAGAANGRPGTSAPGTSAPGDAARTPAPPVGPQLLAPGTLLRLMRCAHPPTPYRPPACRE